MKIKAREHASTLRGLIDGDECDPLGEALTPIAEFLEGISNHEAQKPEGMRLWVLVDAENFGYADFNEGGGTMHYGGEVHISNDTNVDIQIKCDGDDRGDDHCFWPTTEAVVSALGLEFDEFLKDGVTSKWGLLNEQVSNRLYGHERFWVWVSDDYIFVGQLGREVKVSHV